MKYIECHGMSSEFMKMVKTVFSEKENYIDETAIMNLPDDISDFSYEAFHAATSCFKNNETANKFILEKYAQYSK